MRSKWGGASGDGEMCRSHGLGDGDESGGRGDALMGVGLPP